MTEQQLIRVWEHLIAAETRALYFGDLAAAYTRRKQMITGVTFFVSSSAFATILAQAPSWLPAGLALIGAATAAYAMAVNLDGKIVTMGKLHAAWHALASQYARLWDHVWAEEAEAEFARLVEREQEPSELAVSSAPYDAPRLAQWQDRVFALHHLQPPA